jgi:hypothetical protein
MCALCPAAYENPQVGETSFYKLIDNEAGDANDLGEVDTLSGAQVFYFSLRMNCPVLALMSATNLASLRPLP